MEPTVTVRGLAKRYATVAALDGVDLDIGKGEMFALVGPDGAGKTTLLRILAAVLPQDDGEVRILGRKLPRERRAIKRDIGYLSQGFSLYGDLSIDENLAFFAEIYGVTGFADRREELLKFTRLKPFRDRLAGRLSGGMKKKLALACALIHKPKLILLDEPTTGVDPVSRRDFWIILGELLHEGLTIVVATPYLDEAERCARVGLLNEGQFLTVGTPREVKGQIRGELFEVVTEQPRAAKRAVSADELPGLLEMQAQGDRLHLRLDNGAMEGWVSRDRAAAGGVPSAEAAPAEPDATEPIRRFFQDRDIPVSSVRRTAPTLENLFISLFSEERNG